MRKPSFDWTHQIRKISLLAPPTCRGYCSCALVWFVIIAPQSHCLEIEGLAPMRAVTSQSQHYIDLAKPKSGALVSLFSSPSLYWIKTVINLFSTGCRRVSSMDWKTSSGVERWGRIDEVWNLGTMFSQLHTC